MESRSSQSVGSLARSGFGHERRELPGTLLLGTGDLALALALALVLALACCIKSATSFTRAWMGLRTGRRRRRRGEWIG